MVMMDPEEISEEQQEWANSVVKRMRKEIKP
jgi:hypothetical protein